MNEQIITIIRALAPPFRKVDDETIDTWIELAKLFVCDSRFGSQYDRAVALYTLHLMTMNGAMKKENESISSYSQRVSSYTLSGEFSQTFASLSGDNKTSSSINDTPWGKMYDVLLKKNGGGFGLISAAGGRCYDGL